MSFYVAIKPEELVLIKSVASGAHGQVWKAKWKCNNPSIGNRVVAVKKISLQNVIPSQLKKAESEVEILSQLDHPNILKIYGGCVVNTELWVVTEFIKGYDLFKILHDAESDIPWHIRLSWARQAAVGVHALHSFKTPIVHRDIKSLNFMVSEDLSTIKLIDFGFAKFDTVTSELPRGCATPRWAAPETLDYPPIWSPSADIYSLGCMFYEIAVRKLPFYDVDDVRLKIAAKSEARPEIPKNCPEEFANIVYTCWTRDVQSRPPSRALVDRLTTIEENYLSSHETSKEVAVSVIGGQREAFSRTISLKKLWRSSLSNVLGSQTPENYGFQLPVSFGTIIKHELLGKKARILPVKTNSTVFLPGAVVSLNLDSSVEFRRSCQNWSVRVISPDLAIFAPVTRLFSGSGLALLESANIEEGVSVVNDVFHQFFVIPPSFKMKTFSLRFQCEGIKKIKFEEIKCELMLFDQNAHAVLTYFKPYVSDGNNKVQVDCKWLKEKDLNVYIPDNVNWPLVLVFDIFYQGLASPSSAKTSTEKSSGEKQRRHQQRAQSVSYIDENWRLTK